MIKLNLNGDNIKNIAKPKSRIHKIFSKILSFICALIIFFVILFSIGAFLQADVESKNILGNHDYQIFSYNKTDDGTAVFKAFGESFILDLNKVYSIKNRFDEISAINKDYTPAIITLSGDILTGCFSSVSESFSKIPEIIKYFLDSSLNSE
ncbi:MAG: hypothetical protein FWF92_01570 [Oscillospiraceae bacterium]|nr:hypothetical protein [Oscillospiraceae bacterium]